MNKLFRLGKGPLGGVCEGIGNYTNMDPVTWRIIFILGTLFTGIPFVLFYIICWIVVLEE